MRAAKMWAARIALLALASPVVAFVAALFYPAAWWAWHGMPDLAPFAVDFWTRATAFSVVAWLAVLTLSVVAFFANEGPERLWRTAFPPNDGPTVF